MPKKIHEALEKQAAKMKLTGARRQRYIYGALAKMKKDMKK